MLRFDVTSKVARDASRRLTVDLVLPGVQRLTQRARTLAVGELTAAGRIDSGILRNSIATETTLQAGTVVGRVEARTPYAKIVHEGRGPVFPVRRRVLRFQPKGSSTFVFAREVGPVQAVPYLTDALRRLDITDMTS